MESGWRAFGRRNRPGQRANLGRLARLRNFCRLSPRRAGLGKIRPMARLSPAGEEAKAAGPYEKRCGTYPTRWPSGDLRGNIRAMLGEYEQAADEFGKLLSTDIRQSLAECVLFRAECLLAAGNDVGYQQQCQAIFVALEAHLVLSTRKFVIECCTIAPVSSVDPSELVKIVKPPVETPVENSKVQRYHDYFIGISLLRDGQYKEAAQILKPGRRGLLPRRQCSKPYRASLHALFSGPGAAPPGKHRAISTAIARGQRTCCSSWRP